MNLDTPILEIKNLQATVGSTEVLKNLNLKINKGEIHAIMGPNGSGKSTFSKVIVGHPNYKINNGDILFNGKSILNLEPDERARLGIFLAFQYPIELPGVTNDSFFEYIYRSHKENDIEIACGNDWIDMLNFVFEQAQVLDLPINDDFNERNVNEGFSGGEKKRNEILQMLALNSKLSILDEIDSGLDIDGLKIVSNVINDFMNKNKALILITHYKRLLDYVKPNYVHILQDGKITKTGNLELVKKIELNGYDWLKESV
jgi:Fe-S cluster assembly ATP-binding protein